ncbi:hypothetical protein ACIPJG_33305 [Streptomyces halstedii]|uniref:hypothetical protein n=1 Tax=Streptomyces halstedii TaxID=1944 RepID=UPI0037F751BD
MTTPHREGHTVVSFRGRLLTTALTPGGGNGKFWPRSVVLVLVLVLLVLQEHEQLPLLRPAVPGCGLASGLWC